MWTSLPKRPGLRSGPWRSRRIAVPAALIAAAALGCRAESSSSKAGPPPDVSPLAAARVWAAPAMPTARADLARNTAGPGWIDASSDVDCTFVLKPIGGTSPKFYCALASGDVVKVKYGEANPEIAAEVAASRLMAALGFFVDRMMLVRSVRCRGCPPMPMQASECVAKGLPAAVCLEGASQDEIRTFEPAMIERPFEGERVANAGEDGWAWFELDRIEPRAGGSPRADVDALRLMAVLLAHWDNKSDNQRLVCAPGGMRADGSCRSPRAVLHDLGATFGPLKAELPNWKAAPVWADAGTCTVNMDSLPYHGGTFGTARVTEAGRQRALQLLRPITATQLNALFESSGMTRFPHVATDARSTAAWTDTFLAKMDQIAAAGPCPDGG